VGSGGVLLMAKKYLQIDGDGVAYAFCEPHSALIGANLIEVSDSASLGKKWDGAKFIDAPKRYKVWSAVAFATICGQAIYDAIVDGSAKDLRYYKYLLDKADVVDPNIPQYFAMIQALKVRGIMSQAIYDQVMVLE
jgi:hypothetical protein